MKPFKCRKIITISHGNACLKQLMESCQNLYSQSVNLYFPFSESIELIVVHKDESDYEEIELNDLWRKVNQAKT
jgi:hypothetical protein